MRPERELSPLRRRSHHHAGSGGAAGHLPLRAALGLILAFTVSGCACGGDGGDDGGSDGGHALPDSGPPAPPHDPGFNRRTDGWPSDAGVVGAGLVDSILTVASPGAVLSMDLLSTTSWSDDQAPLDAGERITAFLRIDRTLYATVAGTSSGGLLTKPANGTWSRVAGTPGGAARALSVRGGTVFLVSGGQVYTAPSPTGPWLLKSPAVAPLLSHEVRWWVTAPAQQRLFASGDPAFSVGGLYYSDNDGVFFSTGLTTGDVQALGAGGAVVLVRTSTQEARSDNYGSTFHPADAGVAALDYVFGPTQVWAPTATGLKVSTDEGLTWTDASTGLPAGPVRGVFPTAAVLVADTPAGPYLEWLQ